MTSTHREVWGVLELTDGSVRSQIAPYGIWYKAAIGSERTGRVLGLFHNPCFEICTMVQTASPVTAGDSIATVAGGCFWCLEAVYDQMKGVVAVESGYIGGQIDHPTYEAVCSGRTGHAEAVRITFDPTVVSYRELLEVFFVIHDPTTLNRQGHDV